MLNVSLRLRLTLLNLGLVAACLGLFALASYFAAERLALREIDGTLKDRAETVLETVRINPALGISIQSPDVFANADTFVQVIGFNAEVLSKSDNLGQRQLPIDDGQFSLNLRGTATYLTTNVDGVRFRLYNAPSTFKVNGRPILIVQVGRSLRDLDTTLRTLRAALVLVSAIVLALASILSWFMIKRGMRPVTEITAVAERIQRAEDTRQRIEYRGPMDEVGRLAATFNTMLARIQRAFEAQQRFLADASHALRTPLTAIQGNVELLAAGPHDPAEQRDMLEAVRRETRRLSRVVSDLLLLAQADAGQNFQRVPVEMMTVILEVYQQARTLADGVHVSLGHEDIGLVMGDPDRLKEAVLNLVDNAIKYTPVGGRVMLSLYADGPWIRTEVADTGSGIPAEHLPHIFERFYRVPGVKARPGKPSGTGLGLPIAKWIVESHGGKLTVESQVGHGTKFTIWLPATPMN